MEELKLNTIEEAIADFREGKFVIVVDDEDRENEGDLIVAAEKITPEQVNFMLKHARGVLCAPITISRCKELELPHQVDTNTSVLGTPFTVTVVQTICIQHNIHNLKITKLAYCMEYAHGDDENSQSVLHSRFPHSTFYLIQHQPSEQNNQRSPCSNLAKPQAS